MNPDLSWLKETFTSDSDVEIFSKEIIIPSEWFTNESLKESFEEFKVQYPTATFQYYLEWVYIMSESNYG